MPFQLPPTDGVTITALRGPLANVDGSVAYEGSVVVRYESEKLLADRVVVFRGQQRGVAEGRVVLIDPDGTLRADRLEFGWSRAHRFGKAENVEVRVQNAFLHARRADLQPTEWNLYDVEGTTYLRRRSPYLVSSDHVVVTPGKEIVAHQPRITVLGRRVGQIPTQRALLEPGVAGLHYPAPAFKFNGDLGVTWSGGILAGKDATFSFDARSFQNSKPSAFALYTRSFLPISRATQIVAPRTDFAERFYYGYLDSVIVAAPDDEERYLRSKRFSLSGGGQLNGSVVDRDRGTRYSKVEAVVERGGNLSGYGLLGQIRLQGLEREDSGMEPRLTLSETISLPSVRLTPRLSTLARLDSQAFGGRTLYGWLRGEAGVTYTPAYWLRLTAGGFASGEAGRPQFDIDPLYSKGGTLARADLKFAGLRLSYLAKDDRRRGAYDSEFEVNQVFGFVEAYYIYREYPSRHQIGITLRVQPLLDLAKRRTQNEKTKGGGTAALKP